LVFHLAANPDIRVGSSELRVHFDENLAVTFNVLEAMRRSGGVQRVVFASTSTVYGEAEVFPRLKCMGLCCRSVCMVRWSLGVRL
jgi:UDP-glucose 4-epimerase